MIESFADARTRDLFVLGTAKRFPPDVERRAARKLEYVEICDYHSRTRHLMSAPLGRRMKRRPTHPGEMLREDFMPDFGLTVAGLARAAGVSRQSINELLRGRRAVSPDMALRLSRLFGNSAEFWLDAQRAVDLWDAANSFKYKEVRIRPLRVAERR